MKDDTQTKAVTNGEPEEEEEEELVDPQQELRDKCSQLPGCSSLKEKLEACNERINNTEKTEETCNEELIDFMHCIDVCTSKELFSKLK